MAELAALNIKITGDAGDLKAAVNSASNAVSELGVEAGRSGKTATDSLKKIDTAAKAVGTSMVAAKAQASVFGTALARNGAQARGLGGAMGVLGTSFSNNRFAVQNLSYQLQDVAVQMQAGTNASIIFAQQGSQILSAFGPVGAILGGLAAALPLLAFAFMGASETVDTYAKSIKEAKAETSDLALETQRLKEGLASLSEVRLINEIANLQEKALRLQSEALRLGDRRSGQIKVQLKDTLAQIIAAQEELDKMRQVRAEHEQVIKANERQKAKMEEVVAAINKARDAMAALNTAAPGSGWLAGAISSAENLASALWGAATAKAAALGLSDSTGSPTEFGNDSRARRPAPKAPQNVDFGVPAVKSGGGGGGGGGGVNPLVAELEAVQSALATQEQAQLDSYARQQETLQLALEQRLLTQQEYAALMQAAQEQHSQRMEDISVYKYGSTLAQTEQFLGDMASAFSSGGEKMLQMSKAFAAAEAVINAWRAYTQVAADPTLPWYAKIPAALNVLGSVMSAVNAIKGARPGGGGGSGGGASATAAAPTARPTDVRLQTFGSGDLIRMADLGAITTRLNEEYKDGYRLIGV